MHVSLHSSVERAVVGIDLTSIQIPLADIIIQPV